MIKRYLISAFLIIIGIIVYVRFQNYEPTLLKQIQEVKGIATGQKDTLPYPLESNKTSETKTFSTEHITIQTTASYTKVKEFYENILLEKNWKIESQEKNNKFEILKFKKDKQLITIISSLEKTDDKTIVSIDINKGN